MEVIDAFGRLIYKHKPLTKLQLKAMLLDVYGHAWVQGLSRDSAIDKKTISEMFNSSVPLERIYVFGILRIIERLRDGQRIDICQRIKKEALNEQRN